MAKKENMTKRRHARDIALRSLFEHEMGGHGESIVDMIVEDLSRQGDKLVVINDTDASFINQLTGGVKNNITEIDRIIEQHSTGWSPKRMSKIDLCVLRLSVYELLYTDTPDSVCINEAVELSKKYGSEKAPPFINGVLGGIYRSRQKEDKQDSGEVD